MSNQHRWDFEDEGGCVMGMIVMAPLGAVVGTCVGSFFGGPAAVAGLFGGGIVGLVGGAIYGGGLYRAKCPPIPTPKQ